MGLTQSGREVVVAGELHSSDRGLQQGLAVAAREMVLLGVERMLRRLGEQILTGV